MTILYFTATGNSLYVAKEIGGELISIPVANKEKRYEHTDDKIGIIFPVYGLSVPEYVESFIKKLTLHSDYIFSVITCGTTIGGAAKHLLTIGETCDIHFSYINQIAMVDNYLPTFEVNKELEKEAGKEIEQHMTAIVDDINHSKKWIIKSIFGSQLLAKFFKFFGFFNKSISHTFSIEKSCNQCGICVSVCPVNNINLDEKLIKFGTTCITCLSCTHNCPQHSIRMRGEKSTVRYRNKNVTLKEIIDSNI